jgi:D-alanine--poly(phosphoribitol) ligase subunit 1
VSGAPSNLWQAFERHTAGDAIALDFGDAALTFRQLRDEAEAGAAWLHDQGLGAGSVVVLQLPKRRVTYLLWLACIRQGVIYLFVDPANPEARTAAIIRTVRPSLLVTSNDTAQACPTLRIGADGSTPWAGRSGPRTPPPANVHGLSPAYIMFTSGSTGDPKGAVIPHQGVLSLMRWVREWVHEPADEIFSNLNPLHFDNSVFDLYCGLLNGATLAPVDTAAAHNPMSWVRRLREARCTVLFAVPTLFLTLARLRLLSPASLPSARVFLFGGEGFPIDALRAFHAAFRDAARLVNVYGPTETSCICSSILVDEEALADAGTGLVSLGHMHRDFDWLVLDEHGRPVTNGEPGELWIGGGNVGLGYYRNPDETQKRFLQDPRQSDYRSIWYRSGDLVTEDALGRLWFQGRADNQVKVRGHRIELEEIDLAVEEVPGVLRAVAAVVSGADGPEIRVAFATDAAVDIESVRAHCRRRLPGYMQPSAILAVATLPENANGKVDRRATARMLTEAH